jgi:glucuronosyltransferase
VLIRDQVTSPMERAVWFMEHVARTKGAHHLKLASRNLNFFEKYGIDVYLLFLAILSVLVFAVSHIVKKYFWLSRRKLHKD